MKASTPGSSPIAIPNAKHHDESCNVSQKHNTQFLDSDFPPYSRLFVLCDKNASEKDLVHHFSVYGDIEYCKLIKDKSSKSKGFCYVKFKKTSSAAKALEQSEGSRIGKLEFPIKIQIAAKKHASPVQFSSEPEDTPARSRLFVVCPKDLKEKELREAFVLFDDFDYCKVIVDKSIGISKGFAYVKFKKASSAAFAMEEINAVGTINGRPVKVLVADPKSKAKTDNESPSDYQSFSASGSPPSPYFIPVPYAYIPPQVVLTVECDTSLSQADISQMFSRYEGYEYCDYIVSNTPSGEMKAISQVFFTNPQCAAIASSNINGLETPGGSSIQCSLSERSVYPIIPNLQNSPPAGTFYPFMMPGSQYHFYPPPIYAPFPHMENFNEFAKWIRFSSSDALSQDLIGITFSRFGMIECIRMEDEKSGLLKFFEPFCAFAAATELNGSQLQGTVISVFPLSN